MHHALRITEVVEMICSQLGSQVDVPFEKWHTWRLTSAQARNLARLARTSTVFLNPALNVLWRHQGSIVHLLKLMPGDVWEISETSRYEGGDDDTESNEEHDDMGKVKIVLRRLPTLIDCERCLFYSHRVKSFYADEEHFLEPSKVYQTLDSCFPEKPIFPNLQKLDWWPSTDSDSFHYVRLFISPRITDISITFECPSQPVLSLLSSKCPGLKNISIGGGRVSEFVCALPHIETLVAGDLSAAAFSHIARLPGLHFLWLMSSSSIPSISSLRVPAGSLPFPALKKLEYESIEHAPRLLELMQKCALVEFSLFARAISSPPPKIIYQQLYSALAAHCSHSSLQKIRVERGHGWTISADDRDAYIIGGEILRPLFSFRNLVDLALLHPVGVDLDDDLVREMARAWPHIESLHLPPKRSHLIAARITLKGMHALAEHCPRLHTLHLVFDATVVPKIKGKTKKNVCQRSLERLHVAYSHIGKPRPVGKFLSAIFPHLDTITTSCQGLSQNTADAEAVASHKRWKKVEEVLWEI
ncbi:hypothetical protein K438DRAFT_2020555 [Mycena galopus ATCC 62051]|nr:hypothetical protein K438DRAFT_2020555 [Mycena galopus ATCC 62051]